MSTELVIEIVWRALEVTFSLALPILGAGLITGVLVSIFQAVTQINEMTLTFVPKIIVVTGVVVVLLSWMIRLLVDYTTYLYTSIPRFLGGQF